MTREIIGGKRYDTETATAVCEGSWAAGRGDFRSWEATLYRTPKGAYFLDGWGGPMTMWARSVPGGGTGGGEGIIVLDEQAALEFAEKHGGPDVVERFFPDVVEDA